MDSALSFMERLDGIGFGKIDSTTTGKNRRAMKTFVKRPFDELDSTAQGQLKKLCVSMKDFNGDDSQEKMMI